MLVLTVDTVFCNKRFVFLLFGNNIGMLFYLLKFVKKYIDLGKSLTEAFKDFAQAQGYTAKSVKKCFNLAIQGFEKHPKLTAWLDVDLQELKNPANAFNMSAVHRFLLSNGADPDKGFFVLCLGDKQEATALKKRFDKFFPDFFSEQQAPHKTQAEGKKEDCQHPSFALALQAKYFEMPATSPRN